MLKSEMQHQFWITKKTVQRKLGSKEDEHVISSDAELDAKIEIFKSISETSYALSKIIEEYQEHVCQLSQEECVFGRFLKEAGRRSKTTGLSITNTGKAVSYCGQQRMLVRGPLIRIQHEVNVFRYRAVRDTQTTIQNMEKDRTEYRAALSWMKAASAELDPDTGKGLEKFRTSQSAVRNAKNNFDISSLDSIQKIDLLAAARCNMFSHALSAYMTQLSEFAKKCVSTYECICSTLEQGVKYDFTVLKELTQNEGAPIKIADNEETVETTNDTTSNQLIDNLIDTDANTNELLNAMAKDKFLFFADEYRDEQEQSNNSQHKTVETPVDEPVMNMLQLNKDEHETRQDDMIGFTEAQEDGLLLLPDNEEHKNLADKTDNHWWKNLQTNKQGNTMMSLMGSLMPQQRTQLMNKQQQQQQPQQQMSNNKKQQQQKSNNGKYNAWLEMFADLDPLANPDVFDLKLNGTSKNIQQA